MVARCGESSARRLPLSYNVEVRGFSLQSDDYLALAGGLAEELSANITEACGQLSRHRRLRRGDSGATAAR